MKNTTLLFVIICTNLCACMAQTESNMNALYPVKNVEGLYGFEDEEGNLVISHQFLYAAQFSEGLAGVGNGEKLGFINIQGELVIPYQFDYLFVLMRGLYWEEFSFSEGVAKVKKEGKYGRINKEGEVLTDFLYADMGTLSENLLAVSIQKGTKQLWGYVNEENAIVIDFQFFEARDFRDGLAIYAAVNKRSHILYGFIDKNGNPVIPAKYDYVRTFSEGLAVMRENGKVGFIDKTGAQVIPPQFEDANAFGESLAGVKKDDKWGFINPKGELIIDYQFDSVIGNFQEGKVEVIDYPKIDGVTHANHYYVDREGQWVEK